MIIRGIDMNFLPVSIKDFRKTNSSTKGPVTTMENTAGRNSWRLAIGQQSLYGGLIEPFFLCKVDNLIKNSHQKITENLS